MARRLIIEADGGSRGNPGPAAFGALVRDADTDEVLAEVSERIGVATNNVAEYRGLIAGLRAVRDIDPAADLEVRMDSRLVVEQMAGRWKIRHPGLRPLALEAQQLLPAGAVTWRWIPRAENAHADRLLNQALDAATGRAQPHVVTRPAATPERLALAEAEPGTAVNIAADWAEERVTETTLLLLRHAETELTAGRRFSGWGGDDPPLSEIGRGQSEALAAALAADGKIDALVSSPSRRCRETASALADRLGLEPRIDDGWREAAFGEWEGYTFAEVEERWPTELRAWLGSTAVAPPGGEAFDEVARRVAVARDKTLARYPGRRVLVVTHGSPVKILVRLALDAPPAAIFRIRVEPASRTEITYYSDATCTLRSLGR